MQHIVWRALVTLMLVITAASAHAQSWGAGKRVADTSIVFTNAAPNPGIRLLTTHYDPERGLSGFLTSDWYGRMAMEHIALVGNVLHFDVRNLNTPGVPYRHWTATLSAGRVHLTGGIWESNVDQTGRRATAGEVAALTFHEVPLPPLGVLPPDGLARTPPMGWSSWNKFADRIDDATIRQIADAMVSSGLRDAGYRYVNIDDGWQGTRDRDGTLRPNARFPDMTALAAYVHARGLKLGLYSSPGPRTCAGYEGSYGHVEQDAKTFAGWGVDYLKYDLCSGEYFYADANSVQRAYYQMGVALRGTGRPILYSLCEYGRFRVGTWGRSVGGHLWRTTGDITDDYASMARIGFDKNGDRTDAGPGGWNDPDMLEIGNGGMSEAEYRTHMTLWAMSAAPLMMGHDVRTTTDGAKRLLEQRAVIAIDQDPLGIQGSAVRKDGAGEVWTKRLRNGDIAVALFNRGTSPARIGLSTVDVGKPAITTLYDVWNGLALDPKTASFTVAPHDVMLLTVVGAAAER